MRSHRPWDWRGTSGIGMTNILVTGFGPFPGAPVNPSGQLVARLARVRRPALSQHRLATHIFATSYATVDRELPKLLAQHKPQILIMFGLAARTKFLRIEMLAHNRKSRIHPDRIGHIPKTYAIRPGAPSSLRGRAPFARLLDAARATGIEARLSRDAGRYICNYVYWRALDAVEKAGRPDIVVFIHVPKLRSRDRQRSKIPRPTLPQLVHAATAVMIAANTKIGAR
jgi:pyroglutamyl-peptidase